MNAPMHRRSHERVAANYAVQIKPFDSLGDQENVQSCTTRDVSPGGMSVWVDRQLPVESRILITFEHDDFGRTDIESHLGLVVWIGLGTPDKRYVMGIRYVDDQPQAV